MTEKIQARIDELKTERDAVEQSLMQQAQQRISQQLLPYDASIGELERMQELLNQEPPSAEAASADNEVKTEVDNEAENEKVTDAADSEKDS